MLHLDKAQRLAYTAMVNGGERKSLVRTEWDVSGKCSDKKVVTIHSRPSPRHRVTRTKAVMRNPEVLAILAAFPGAEVMKHPEEFAQPDRRIVVGPSSTPPQTIEMTVRCRKCDWCREQRRRMWARRAIHETKVSTRTWFGTLTLNPDQQNIALARARMKTAAQGVDFDSLAWGEQFGLQHAEISPEITKYLKRIRKALGKPGAFKYLLVAEHHQSGLPHYHILVHECDPATPVRKRLLQEQWFLGFTNFKLVEDVRRATYVCKYLSKSSVARVRSSELYGEQTYFNIDVNDVVKSRPPKNKTSTF